MMRRILDSDTPIVVGLAVLCLAVYLRTLCPTIYTGDCGELAAAAYTLGIAHPTGYPVWCLLGKAWTLLVPFGSIIWRLNVLSAVFGTMATVALFAFARTIGLSRNTAFACAGLFAFSFTFWQQCLITETYSLTALYTCGLLFLAARWRSNGCKPKDLRWFAAVYGLAMTNHQTNTLFIPGFLAFILMTHSALLTLRDAAIRRQWLATVACWIAPLAFYLYIPLRAAANPAVDWGHPVLVRAFLYHLSGGYFRAAMFSSPPHDVWMRFCRFGHDLPVEFAWPLVGLAIVGAVLVWTRDRPLAILLTWIVTADVFYTINYSIYNGYIYLIPSYVVLSVSIGYGLFGIRQLVERASTNLPRSAFLAWSVSAAMVGLVAWQISAHRQVGLAGTWICYDYALNILKSAPPNAIIVDNNEIAGYSALTYLQKVENLRPDVVVFSRGLMVRSVGDDWVYREMCRKYPRTRELFPMGISADDARTEAPLRRIIASAVSTGQPVLIDDLAGRGFLDYLRGQYDVAQTGLVARVYARGHRPSNASLYAETVRTWGEYETRGVYQGAHRRDAFLTPVAIDYAYANLARANLAFDQRQYPVAAMAYQNVLALFPSDEAVNGLHRCAVRTASRTAPHT